MSDIGDDFRASKKYKQECNRKNAEKNYSILKGLNFEDKDTAFLFREKNKPKVDFYPHTGKWKVIDGTSEPIFMNGGANAFKTWYMNGCKIKGEKIKCFCIACPQHPLFEKRKEMKWWTGSNNPCIYADEDQIQTGVEVDCFIPTNKKIDDGRLDVDELIFNESYRYIDGYAATNADWEGDEIQVSCKNEKYQED